MVSILPPNERHQKVTLPFDFFFVFSVQAMDAGSYNFAIAFQERIKISDEKMAFYDVTFLVHR